MDINYIINLSITIGRVKHKDTIKTSGYCIIQCIPIYFFERQFFKTHHHDHHYMLIK